MIGVTPEDSSVKRYVIDVNGYYGGRFEKIKMQCKIIANRAKEYGTDVEMEPMNGIERYVAHCEIAKIPGVKSESRGMGKDRRIVISESKDADLEL